MKLVQYLRFAALACSVLGTSVAAQAEGYPSKPVEIVVPYSASGIADSVARLLSNRLARDMKQPFVVENKAGAAGAIGTNLVAQAKADGHTLLLASSSFTTTPILYRNIKWDPLRDFTPIALICEIPSVILVNAKLPVSSLPELVRYAQERPGKLNYSSAGNGSVTHLIMELLQQRADVKLTHIPYRGQPEAVQAVAAGNVQVMATTVSLAMPMIQSGKVRPIAVTGRSRVPVLKDIPTVIEAGYPDFEATTWFGLVAPAGTDPSVIALLATNVRSALADEGLRSKLRGLGAEINLALPKQFSAFLTADSKRWAKTLAQANVQIN